MKRTVLFGLIFIVFAGASLPAQTFSLVTGREPVTSLDGLWRFHTGDNPAWASPSFDDSDWLLIRSDESWTAQGYRDDAGYAWYRFKIQVPDGSRPPDLLLPAVFIGYQLYANGRLIGGEGSIVPTRNPVFALVPQVYDLPPGVAGPQFIQIAIRVWYVAGLGSGGGMLEPGSLVGAPAVLARELSRDQDERTAHAVSGYGYCLLASLVGLTTLVLFFSRPEDREYLWFSVLLLAGGAEVALALVRTYVTIPATLYFAVSSTVEAISAIAALFFFSMILRTRRSFLWWVACAGAVVYPIGLLFYYFGWASWGEGHAVGVTLMLPADVWFLGTLGRSTIRKSVSAGWLLAPAVLYYGFNFLLHLSAVSVQLGWRTIGMPLDFALISRPFSLSLSDIYGYAFVLSLLIFLVRRFSAVRQEEARLSQEFEAARSVQSLLVPVSAPTTPGFQVESIYRPASEVGGDFFQVMPADDGSLLIVIGDVSGKGLKAAMAVSAIVGALRNETERRPAQILARLNRVLHGQITGFATCIAVLIASDGGVTLANAGHLSPYRNGTELPIASGLPLAISAEPTYEETHDKFAPGDRLTFVSDGVVEATNAKRELYGFERTLSISNQSAAAIAETAQRWGQEDDITVLSLTFAPVGVAHV